MPRTRVRVIIASAISIVLGIAALWISSVASSAEGLSNTLATAGTVALTIGIVDLVSEFYVRKEIFDDISSLIESDRRLLDSGVDNFATLSDVDWRPIFAASKGVECVVRDPQQFKNVIWPRVLQSASSGSQEIDLAFPKSGGPAIEQLANEYGRKSQLLEVALGQVVEDIEKEWKAKRASVASFKSSLVVRSFDELPRHALVISDEFACIIIEAVSRSTGHSDSHLVVFRRQSGGRLTGTWLSDSLEALSPNFSAPIFSDRKEKRTSLKEGA